MNQGRDVPDLARMQAFVVALAESKALADSKARARPLTRGGLEPGRLSERAAVAIASARALERRYRSTFEALPVAALLSDRSGEVRAMNRAARELLELSGRSSARPVQRLFEESAEPRIARALERVAPSPATLRVRLPASIFSYVELRAIAVGDEDVLWTVTPESPGREASLTRRLVDKDEVIEHQRARIEALERESRTKDKFIAVLGHDLRAPLNAVLGWTQLLRREPLDTVGRERALATIERNARSQAALIDELLDVTRMNEGKLALEISACDVALIVRRTIEAALPDAARLGVDLSARIEAAAAGAPVAGDRTRLEQIVANLVANSLKFTPAGGAVQVLVSRDGSEVRVEVRDTGKGIVPEHLPHVFKWLRQGGDGPPTREGLGLGLFIVRRLTELHGGAVEARSDGADRGATFIVRLPCCVRAGVPAPASELLPELGELDGIEVLVVEDETDAVELLARVLAARGAKVTAARDATSALGIALPRPPDVIVTDLGLPDMDGYELVRRVRLAHGRRVGVIALSGFTAKDSEPAGDLDERLVKPVDIGRLTRAIQRAASAVRAFTATPANGDSAVSMGSA